MDQKSQDLPQKQGFTKRNITVVVVLFIVTIFLTNSITYSIASPPKSFGPGGDRWDYYEYSIIFENIKCMNTDDKYNEYDILETLYYLGITKERAKELFQENKEKLEQKIAAGRDTGLDRCQQETLQYYDKALDVLDHLGDTAIRKQNQAKQEQKLNKVQ